MAGDGGLPPAAVAAAKEPCPLPKTNLLPLLKVGLDHWDGSVDLAQQNLQIPEHANGRTLPSWRFDAHLSARDRVTSSRPDTILVTPFTD